MTRFARKWTPAEVINGILTAAIEGQDLSYAQARKRDPALVRAAEREFGAWGAAVEAAGFDYDTIRRYRRWTRDRVIARIRELYTQGADLSWYMVMTRIDPPLAAAALHAGRFSSWNEALHAAGLDPRKIARYQRWTPELVRQEVHKIVERGVPLDRRTLKERAAPLLAAIDRLGGLTELRTQLELPRATVRTND